MFNLNTNTMTAVNTTKVFKRFGLAGTLFFTVKGLLWLIVPALIAKGL